MESTPGHFDRTMTRLALAGSGWAELAATLSAATGSSCRVLGPRGEVQASSDGTTAGLTRSEVARVLAGEEPVSVVCADGWRAKAARLLAGRRGMGALLISEPASEAQIAHLRASITAMLIEAVRRDASAGGAALTGDVLVDGLRGVIASTPADLLDTGTQLGWDLNQPHRAIALHYGGQTPARWAGALSWLDRPTAREGRFAWTLAAGEDDVRELAAIRAQLGTSVGTDEVTAASGPVARGPEQTRASFTAADGLLRLGALQQTRDLAFSAAGLAQLLVGLPPETLAAFAADHLRPLAGRPELIETLTAWLDTGGSRRAVSERLHLHRNSVGYRVAAIRRLLGRDPLDPAVAPALSAALLAELLAPSGLPTRITRT